MAKHFHLTITEETLSFVRNPAAIAAEAALDGFYFLRTSVPAKDSTPPRPPSYTRCRSLIYLPIAHSMERSRERFLSTSTR